MAKERGNPEVFRTFDVMGCFVEKRSDLYNALRFMGKPKPKQPKPEGGGKPGRPDYVVIRPPYGYLIEVKAADVQLAFSEISEAQREQLDQFVPSAYLWVFLGDGPTNGKVRPRRAYLVPWLAWKQAEARLQAYGYSSLPYEPRQLVHRQAGLAAGELLADFALQWVVGERRWCIPSSHPFWSPPERVTPKSEQVSTCQN